jgi:uncharacterized RDD family membrane protein YckC
MQPCSCGVAHEDTCPVSESPTAMPEVSSDLPLDKTTTGCTPVELSASNGSPSSKPERASSTLIEFPGVTRAVPAWRKQLNQRVREVQELRAREAAEAAAAAQASGGISVALPSAQLELVPDQEQQVMNPIVSRVLERLERAHRSDFAIGGTATAAATALAPVTDGAPELEALAEPEAEVMPKKPTLVVVPPLPAVDEPKRKPVRVISDNVENAALSYLETCLSVPVIAADTRWDRAGNWRRMIAAVLDLLVMALMAAPIVAGIRFAAGFRSDPRLLAVMGGSAALIMFAYLTVTIALTGRTLGMRVLSLRTIDVRTGLIPTGGQATKRAVGYIFSLSTLGLGIIYALLDREGRTVHDRFSRTIVVKID